MIRHIPKDWPGFAAVAFVSCLFAFGSSSTAQCAPDQLAELNPPSPGDTFGDTDATDIDGTTAVVGDDREDTVATDSGAAYVYDRATNGSWNLTAVLKANDAAFNDRFGNSVAISGDVIVIGAFKDDHGFGNTDRGSAYVFERNAGGAWIQTARLQASDAVNIDEFGTSVDVSNGRIVVGKPKPLSQTGGDGSAYVFTKNFAGIWTELQQLPPSSPSIATRLYGDKVAIDGDFVIVARKWSDAGGFNAGGADIFKWSQGPNIFFLDGIIGASNSADGDNFGLDVDIDHETETALVGSWTDTMGPFSGSAYVYRRQFFGFWSEDQQIFASDAGQQDHFGWAVSIDGDAAVIGAWGNGFGMAYEFERNGTIFTEIARFDAPNTGPGDSFGRSVEISGDRVVIGNPTGQTNAYVFGGIGGIGTNYGPLAPNSAGPGAIMSASGSASVSANNLVLEASGCPPSVAGIFIYGGSQVQIPLFDGFLLTNNPLQRINMVVVTNGSGDATLPVDLTMPPFTGPNAITPGSRWNFQFWYRDNPAGMTGANLSNALSIQFCN